MSVFSRCCARGSSMPVLYRRDPRALVDPGPCGLIAAMGQRGKPFATIAVVGRQASPGITEPLERLARFLFARGHRVLIDAETAAFAQLPGCSTAPTEELGREATLGIVVGGDGTMLSAARRFAPFGMPLIGINQGRLGFLTDVTLAGMEATLSAMLDGAYVEETRTLLEAELSRASGGGERSLALNDVVVNRGALRLDGLCALGAGSDRRSHGRGDSARARVAPRVHLPSGRSARLGRDRNPAPARQGRQPALRWTGGFSDVGRRSRCGAPRRTARAPAASQGSRSL